MKRACLAAMRLLAPVRKDPDPLGTRIAYSRSAPTSLASSSTMLVVLSVATPPGKTTAEFDAEMRFFRSVQDLD